MNPESDDYTKIPDLAAIYLEDSWLLAIHETADSIVFLLDAVLLETHPAFTTPQPDEQYCYRHGQLLFTHHSGAEWITRTNDIAHDATGKPDHGNIDIFRKTTGGYYLEGQFGKVQITTDSSPTFRLITS